MSQAFEYQTDVLVIGTGPMGATTALALATHGLRVHVVNRFNWTANSPRAHITNQRAMEVLRDLGVEEEARHIATPWEWMGDTLFTTSLAGPEIARLRTWGTGDERKGDYMQGSPCPLMDLTQEKMEPVLVKNAAERGAVFSFNTEYLSHEQDADGVTVRLRDEKSGREYTVRARYLLGADGARSKVMDDLGLKLEGQLARAATAYVIFRADLARYAAHRPSILYWIVTSDTAFGEIGMGLLRCIEPWKKWIAGWGYDMSRGEPDFSPEEVKRKVRLLVGDPDLEIDIQAASTWYVNQAHAPVYSKGRVFCGGDAVHRHPPSSGLGSNTCMQDAFNLAWKLAFVVKGYAGPRLLDSYSLERAPVGAQIVARANQSRLDYGPLNRCFRDEGAADPVAAGLEKLADPGPEGAARRDALAKALDLKNYEFNAQGLELNQRCVSDAVIPDPDAGEEVFARDPQLYLQPTTRPGAKLPHVWLVGEDGRRISTLDVVGKGRYSLVTGIAGHAWADAAQAMDLPYLRTVVIGRPGALDLYSRWHAVREIDEAGALLVRPDGVVAWRHARAAADAGEARHKLRQALAMLLDHPSQAEPT
ncbi:FAD-dependent monooxygenase [Parapusillimonas granuli]|uniref:FAD-dependent monooxygenase n=1 Tax=Parapusillimonas granuli TaxID=380911 RepID=A0A853G1U2_9BURK|nr:FAD-dependent monooxygenase [Parapusillimonas granuli]MBB5216979.1 2,4-dichlorophenol 6-monooxygenase [Parapusillimonas granuli]MEB2400691.1 FAD-dependent monooxygenase [Alcaligenaceae bacterium]NYT50257.1 FAD-dependent monooxygenase [Parapusillimonas granuli]